MPYIARDFTGKIVGVYTCPQPQRDGTCLTEPDPLPADHPEIVEFMKGVPVITQAGMTEDDFRREREDHDRMEKEIPLLQNLVLQHMQAWTQLETALSSLLHAAINIQPPSSLIAYAIYYGLNGFDARLTVVNNTIIQLLDENKDLEQLRDHWTKIERKIVKAKFKRNSIAHGTIQKLIYGKPRKRRAVLSPLPFDVIRINRAIKSGEDPGMPVNELEAAVARVANLAYCVDGINIAISGFHQAGKDTLLKTLPALEVRLKEIGSQ